MRIFVVDFSETHQNMFKTLYMISRNIWGDKVFGITTSDVYYKLDIPMKGIVFGVGKDSYKNKKWWKAKLIVRDMVDSWASVYFILRYLRPKASDIFLFSTFEPWFSRHFMGLIYLYRYLYSVKATVIPTIHNTFYFFYPENVSQRENKLIEKHIKHWKGHVRLRYNLSKTFLTKQMFDGFITLGTLKMPTDIDNLVFLDRWYERDINSIGKFNKFTIVVPGSVSLKRRNYREVASAVSKLPFNTRVVLLGKLIDEEVLDYFPDSVELIYYKTFVPEQTYIDMLKKSHVVVAPVIDEFYGKYSVTGGLGDGVMAGIPVLCPAFYGDNRCLLYNSTEKLADLLIQVKEGKVKVIYDEWSLDSMSEKLKRYVQNILLRKRVLTGSREA